MRYQVHRLDITVGKDQMNRREMMNRKDLAMGLAILMVTLAFAGCGPHRVAATEKHTFGPAFARDAAMASLWTESTPLSDLRWSEEDLTPQNLVGRSTIRYTAGDWVVTVAYPIVAPEATVYQVDIVNSASGLAWSGEVDAQGNVTETAGGGASMANPASVYCEEQGGTVEMRTGADGGQVGICVFADGSECEEWAFFRDECGPGGSPPVTVLDQEAAYQGVRFFYNQAIAAGVAGETVAAEAYMGDDVIPEHLGFSFDGYVLSGAFHQPRILVYRVSAFAANSERAAAEVDSLRALLDSRRLPAPGGGFSGRGLPFLPLFNAGQLLHTQVAFVDFHGGWGVRFLTEYAQYAAPINNTDLFYTFQGLTDDGQYYVAAILPVAHPSLPADSSQIPGGDPDAFADTYETYASDMAQELAGYGAAEFTPDLALLDAMIASLEVAP